MVSVKRLDVWWAMSWYFPFLITNSGPSYTALKNNFFESCVFLIIYRIGEQEIVSWDFFFVFMFLLLLHESIPKVNSKFKKLGYDFIEEFLFVI